jgi:hypothetical protein
MVKLDERAPMTLLAREATWLLVTDPALPTPGEPVQLHIWHVGAAETFPGEALTLSVGSESLEWEAVDQLNRTVRATYQVPVDIPSLNLTLSLGADTIASWTIGVGFGVDLSKAAYDLYPTRPIGTVLDAYGWQVHLYAPPGGMNNDVLSNLMVTNADGEEVESQVGFGFGRHDRLTVSVPWESLTEIDTLLVRDHTGGWTLPLPVTVPPGQASLTELVDHVTCGLLHSRLRVGHDRAFGAVGPIDAQGDPLTLPADSLVLRVEGGEIAMPLQRVGELRDLGFAVVPSDVVGPGRVVVENLLGDELGSCVFECQMWSNRVDTVATHWVTLSREEIDLSTQGRTTRLRIGLMNDFDELLGAGVWPEVLLAGGFWSEPIALTDAGTFSGTVQPDAGADQVTITLTIAGRVLETLIVLVTGTAAPEEPQSTTDPVGGSPEGTTDEGCATGRSDTPTWLLVLLAILARRRQSGLARCV